jgi:hypothetical protein
MNDIKRYIIRRYSFDELESILNQKLNNQSRNLKHYADKSLDKFMNIVVYSITDEILEQLTDGWVEDSPIPEKGLYEFIEELFGERIIKKYDELRSMNLQETIRRILKEETEISSKLRRRYPLIDNFVHFWVPIRVKECSQYNSDEDFLRRIIEDVTEAMYYTVDKYIDDSSEEWEKMYIAIENRITIEFGESIKNAYHINCGD